MIERNARSSLLAVGLLAFTPGVWAATLGDIVSRLGLPLGGLTVALAALMVQLVSKRKQSLLLTALAIALTILMLLMPAAGEFLLIQWGALFALQSAAHVLLRSELHQRRWFLIVSSLGFVVAIVCHYWLGYDLAWLTLPMLLSALACFDAQGQGYRSVVAGLAQERSRNQRQMHELGHDTTTGLPNLLRFEQIGNNLIRTQTVERLSLMLIKMNNFDQINRVLGHSNGDLLLAQAGQRIQKKLQKFDSVLPIELVDGVRVKVANLGGVNFGLLIGESDKRYPAHLIANAFVENLMEPLVLQSCALEFDVAVGIARYPEQGTDIAQLIDQAHDAINAGGTGPDKGALYSPKAPLYSNDRISLMAELRQAIDSDQLSLHVQPLINLQDDSVAGGEVFIRWQHPQKGDIPPVEFIELAEQTGVLFSLTQWILGQVIVALQSLQQAGLSQRLSVNIGNTDLLQVELVETIDQLCEKAKVDSRMLTLEIKESALLAEPDKALDMMRHLQRKGVGIALDNFGSGYTSLAMLRRLPLTELKIDSSIMTTMVDSDADRSIVSAIVDIAAKMSLDVVAEGVETQDAADAMRAMGCSKAQGFYFARPFALDSFAGWIKERNGGEVECE